MARRGPKVRSLAERLWARVNKSGECWIWTGCVRPDNGHGQINRGARGAGVALAHIAAYELLVGPVPRGLILHHTCLTPACVNPNHLQPLTRAEHVAIHAALRTICKHGHLLDGQRSAYGKPFRYCKTCNRKWNREYHQRKKAAA